MATMDVFASDAFSMQSLTAAIQTVDFQPQMLGQMGLFAPQPVRVETVSVEKRETTLSLVQTTPRAAPIPQRTTEARTLRNFSTVRIAKGDRIRASEIQNIRAFGSETEMMQVQAEVARRLGGPGGLISEIEYTKENMRLGAVQGIVLDADGTTIVNFFTEFGIAQPAEIDFDLDNATPAAGALRTKIANSVVRPVARALKMGGQMPVIHALCGETFYDQFVAHTEVRASFLNYQAAASLRDGVAFGSFPFGGVIWHEYRGSDDDSTISVGATKCKIFPQVPGLFREAMSPGEAFDFVNTPGLPMYSRTIPDRDRNEYIDIEVMAYPLFICTRPDVLLRGKNT